MQLNPNDWWIHVRSTRDLADRMLVRGDTKGAEVMLKAAVDLEKRYNAAVKMTRYASASIDVLCSSALERLATSTVAAKKTECNLPHRRNDDTSKRGTSPQLGRGIGDMGVPACGAFSPVPDVDMESDPLYGFSEDLKPPQICEEIRYRAAVHRHLAFEWTLKFFNGVRSIIETTRQCYVARFVPSVQRSANGPTGCRIRPPRAGLS
jgi:hypothetical protein